MKYTNVAIAALLGCTTVQGQEEWDEDFNAPEDWEQEEVVYDGAEERQAWIYGIPGEDNYREEGSLSGEDVLILEEMWEIDLEVQKKRGSIQGWHRGFYKDYDWEMKDTCFNRESVEQIYWIKRITTNFEFSKFGELQGLLFNLYFMFDHECEIDKSLNDLANFCFDHDCSGETLL